MRLLAIATFACVLSFVLVQSARADFLSATPYAEYYYDLRSEMDNLPFANLSSDPVAFAFQLPDPIVSAGALISGSFGANTISLSILAGKGGGSCGGIFCPIMGGLFFDGPGPGSIIVSELRFIDHSGTLEAITGVQLASSDLGVPFGENRIHFGANSITFDFAGLTAPPDIPMTQSILRHMSFNVSFESVSPIPEPETYAMLLAGLGLLGFAARRRKLNLAA